MFQIFSREKSFDDPWVGSPLLNQMGLHVFRMKLARLCNGIRFMQSGLKDDTLVQALRRDGYIQIHDFLPAPAFEAILAEAEESVRQSEHANPVKPRIEAGFGEKQQYPWGFDRYDGGTLNRFINIDASNTPGIAQFCQDQRLEQLTKAVAGRPHKPHAIWIYLTVHGDETQNEDDQKNLHRDTFFGSMKFWYFLHTVAKNQGPFAYVKGSNQLDEPRKKWERAQALKAIGNPEGERESSFRIEESELPALGLNEPEILTVPANTLVLADTFGFHKRCQADIGARRLALYGNLRPHPYGLMA